MKAGRIAVWFCLCVVLMGQEVPEQVARAEPEGGIVLPPAVPDPLEPVNRIFWSFNQGLLTYVIQPTSRGYRLLVPKPVRRGIQNFSHNLTWPGRLVNNLLQGRWAGAGDETHRFLCNSTFGLAGFRDVAGRWNIPRSEADFGQTFGRWGWSPDFFLMLPVLGPSNDRDLLGLAADTAANPLLYIAPYKLSPGDPFTYLGPYSYLSYLATYNRAADTVRDQVRFLQTEMDPYWEIHYAWTFIRENRVADFRVEGSRDEAALETLESVFFGHKDPEFPDRGVTRSVRIASTGRNLKFTLWLQPGQAAVVYILPGLGSHRLSESCLALAELVYNAGYSAVTISSAFHSEFMEQASTAAVPGSPPVDAGDVHLALEAVDRLLANVHGGRIQGRALLGYSMGGFHSLFIAAGDDGPGCGSLKFDRHVAIDPPVRMSTGIAKLDAYYQAPMAWPEAERTARIENTFLKVAALSRDGLRPSPVLPFDEIESRFLIGAVFRLKLRDVLFSSQRRINQGVLKGTLVGLRRKSAYEEIQKYSFQDYFDRFVIPYYAGRGMPGPVGSLLNTAADLTASEAGLAANAGVRILVNQNDFLLDAGDLAWLERVFPASRLRIFPRGGHLGNLANPEVQRAVVDALSGLVRSKHP